MINLKRFNNHILILALMSCAVWGQTTTNWVDGSLVEFLKGGVWCWFQDERAVIDTVKNKLIIGSANMQSGVDLTIYDIQAKKVDSKKTFGGLEYADDHNSPGLLICPNGNYLAIWAHHYDKYNSRYSIFNGQQWSAESRFDWNKIPGGTNYTIAYSNLCYLSSEKRIYNFARANNRAPNFIYSDDNGSKWTFGGQLTTNSSNTYNKGYYKYWGNGVDRIDMVFTEQHPRDDTTSIYHGYITGKKTYSTDGKIADEDIYDTKTIPTFESFTKVFAHNTKVNGITFGRCWQSDLMRYDDGTIAIIFFARANDDTLDHRNFYSRYDGKEWKTTYIGKAGKGIYASEQDYTGLGSLCPDDPNRMYISSPYNPGDDSSTPKKREIWRGTTTNKGATWTWTPVTANSSDDNFRPIIPKWTPGKEALLWFRGKYVKAQDINANVVGVFYDYKVGASEKTISNKPITSSVSVTMDPSGFGLVSLQYSVPKMSPVALQIFSVSGTMVGSYIKGIVPAGNHRIDYKTAALPSGIYLAQLSIGHERHSVRMVLQK